MSGASSASSPTSGTARSNRKPSREVYLPITQQPDWGSLDLVVRSRAAPAALASSVRAALREEDPALPLGEVQMLDEIVQRAVSPRRFVVQVLGAFALAAVVLAALGIYGVVSYSVGQRMQEFGIRMALGASNSDVLFRVMTKTLLLTFAGVCTRTARVTRPVQGDRFPSVWRHGYRPGHVRSHGVRPVGRRAGRRLCARPASARGSIWRRCCGPRSLVAASGSSPAYWRNHQHAKTDGELEKTSDYTIFSCKCPLLLGSFDKCTS